jgi:hypothetical protein
MPRRPSGAALAIYSIAGGVLTVSFASLTVSWSGLDSGLAWLVSSTVAVVGLGWLAEPVLRRLTTWSRR